MPARPSLAARLRTVRPFLAWVLLGRPDAARRAHARLATALPQHPAFVPSALEFLGEDGMDTRWGLLVGRPPQPGRPAVDSAALAWHLAYVLIQDLGPEGRALFWSAASACASRPSVPFPPATPGFESLDALAKARRGQQGEVARALVSVFPDEAAQASGWEQAWGQWCRQPRGDTAVAVGQMLHALVEPSAQCLPETQLQQLRAHAPVSWPLWLVLLDNAPGLAHALRQAGGPSQWPGTTAPVGLPASLAHAVDARRARLAQALERLAAPRPDPKALRPGAQDVAQARFLVSHAGHFSALSSIGALASCGVAPTAADLERALSDPAPFTACCLIRAGALLPRTDPMQGLPWQALFASPLTQQSPTKWKALERELLSRTDPAWVSPVIIHGLLTQALEHPLAADTVQWLVERIPNAATVMAQGWRATPGQDRTRLDPPVQRSFLTLLAHHGQWDPATRQAIIVRVLDRAAMVADALVDDLSSQKPKGNDWERTQCRPVCALTWALVHAPRAVPAMLARSSRAQIQQALDLAGAYPGWSQGHGVGAYAKQVPHDWKLGAPAWFQAAQSVDARKAMEALAEHPLCMADLQVRREVARTPQGTPVHASGLDFLLAQAGDTHAAANAIALASGAGIPIHGCSASALRSWLKPPRDLAAIAAGLHQGNLLAACVTPDGGTALAHAIQERDEVLAGLLLEMGADPDIPDAKGITPTHLARQHGSPWPEILAHHAHHALDRALPAGSVATAVRPRM